MIMGLGASDNVMPFPPEVADAMWAEAEQAEVTAAAVEAGVPAPAGPPPLTSAEIYALRRMQEDMVSLQAYAMTAQALGIDPLDVTAVKDALHARDITVDETLSWLQACDYNLDCYREAMNLELAEGQERARASMTGRWLSMGALAVLGTVAIMWWKK